jgi:hypothetical protein
MGMEVPDSYTFPSSLQRLINQDRSSTKVINYGSTTITTRHQLFILRNYANIQAGDIVLFFYGVNDAVQSLYYKNPKGNMVEENRSILASLPFSQRILHSVWTNFSTTSSFVRRFLNPYKPARKEIFISEDLANEFISHYQANITAANEWVSSKSAIFFHFLQPNIYTLKSFTLYESHLVAGGPYPLELEAVFRIANPLMKSASEALNQSGVRSIDLTSAFDNRQQEIFLDFCHVNHYGNGLIARSIFFAIRSEL